MTGAQQRLLTQLVLASGSPRRRTLLEQMGVRFIVDPADVDETPLEHEPPRDYVRRVAEAKAIVVARRRAAARQVVLAADTTVALDGCILAKPADADEARAMLARLSGRVHEVFTAIAVVHSEDVLRETIAFRTRLVRTEVEFRTLDVSEIDWYVRTGEPLDKAGAYGLQGVGGMLVRAVTGSVSNVVGLPLAETVELLREVGVCIGE